MTSTEDAQVTELLHALGLASRGRSVSASSIHDIIETASLLDIVLYMNTYETVLFWSLRSLVRALHGCCRSSTLGSQPTEWQEEARTRYATLSRACDAVQAAQDVLHDVVVPYLVKPSVMRVLRLYVDEALFDDSTLARDVEALFSANAYCVETAQDDSQDEEEDDDVEARDGSEEGEAEMDGEGQWGTDEEEDHCAVGLETDDELSVTRDPRANTSQAQTQARAAERQRQRRWQRARDRVLHAPPPLSSAATLILSLVKTLLQVYLRAQPAHPSTTVVASDATTGAACACAHTPSHTRRLSHLAPPPSLPGLFPCVVGSMTGYQALVAHPYTMAALLPMAAYAQPPAASLGGRAGLKNGRPPHNGSGTYQSSSDRNTDAAGLVLVFRQARLGDAQPRGGGGDGIKSAPDTVSCRRHRGWPSTHIRDPFARAAALRHARATSQSGAQPPPQPVRKRLRDDSVESVPNASVSPSPPLAEPSARHVSVAGLSCVPNDVQHLILLFLPPRCVGTAARVCRLWRCWVTNPPRHFASPLPYYAAASRAATRSYLHFFREDWGERCVRLPTLTAVQRLHAVRLRQVAAVVQAVWDAVEADSVVRQWVCLRARDLRAEHAARVGRHGVGEESVLTHFVEPRLEPLGELGQESPHTQHTWGCASSSSASDRLPVEYVVLYVWHEYPRDAPPRQSLVFLLEALRHALLFTLVVPPVSDGPAHRNEQVPPIRDGRSSQSSTALAVEEVLRQQYLLWALLQADHTGGSVGPRAMPILYELWRNWPRVSVLWTEMQQTEETL